MTPASRRWLLVLPVFLALPAFTLLDPQLAAQPEPATAAEGTAGAGTLVVGSKNFEESRLLAELFAQVIEAETDLRVERRFDLAGTQVCFEALRTGALDVYPEYTGTGLASILGEEPLHAGEGAPAGSLSARTLARVRRAFRERWDLTWLAPLGFGNAYEIAVPRSLAEAEDLATLSDLSAVAPELVAGFGYEFIERPDGLPGLAETYGLRFAEVRPLQQTLKYRAAARGDIRALDVYTTDGRLLTYDLVVLEDDRGFFPPYDAAPLARGETLERHPEVGRALGLLAGILDEDTVRRANLRLQEEGDAPAAVARDLLSDLGLASTDGPPLEATTGRDASFFQLVWDRRASLLQRTVEHLAMSGIALALGVLLAVPLGLALERRRRLAEPVIRALSVTQTIPSLALLAFMIPLLGVGVVPAVVALWVYSLFPILRSTYTGVRDAAPDAVDAALSLGMTPLQALTRVRLPLAASVIMAGVRTAAVLVVGTATLAAFIGAGGLGEPIVTGLQLADGRMILSGAIPAALLAIAVDLALGAIEAWLAPRGLG